MVALLVSGDVITESGDPAAGWGRMLHVASFQDLPRENFAKMSCRCAVLPAMDCSLRRMCRRFRN